MNHSHPERHGGCRSFREPRVCGPLLFLILLLLQACSSTGEPLPLIDQLNVQEPARGYVAFSYRIQSATDGPISIAVEYQLAQSEWIPASSAQGTSDGSGTISQGEIRQATFLWNSWEDVGFNSHSCRLRVIARSPDGERISIGQTFDLHNEDLPPQVAFGPFSHLGDGRVEISIGLADNEEDTVSLKWQYRPSPSAAWKSATLKDPEQVFQTTAGGDILFFNWLASTDLGENGAEHAQLRLTASDSQGPGLPELSDPINLKFDSEYRIEIQTESGTFRAEVPIAFKLFGPAGGLADVGLFFATSDSLDSSACSIVQHDHDPTLNLRTAPEGVRHILYWDSRSDLSEPIVRDLRIRVEVSVAGVDESEQADILSPISVDNAEMIAGPVISEIYDGNGGPEAFLELAGPAGYALDGLRLYEMSCLGEVQEALGNAFIRLDGYFINDNGVFVVSGSDGPADADLMWDRFHTFFQQDGAYNLFLDMEESEYAYDAIGIGDFSTCSASRGEGDPADEPPAGQSLTRDLANTDANDNRLDFIWSDPSPGEAHFWPAEEE